MPHGDHVDRWQRAQKGATTAPTGPLEHIEAMRGLLSEAEAEMGRRIRRDNAREHDYWHRHFFSDLIVCDECGARGAHHPACPMLGPGDYYEDDSRRER